MVIKFFIFKTNCDTLSNDKIKLKPDHCWPVGASQAPPQAEIMASLNKILCYTKWFQHFHDHVGEKSPAGRYG